MIPHALSGLDFVERFYSFPVLKSTHEYATGLQKVPKNGKIFVIQADQPSRDHTIDSEPDSHDNEGTLYVSICSFKGEKSFYYQEAISIAVLDAILQLNQNAPLSFFWPHELLWSEKKIGYFITEENLHANNMLVSSFELNVNNKSKHLYGKGYFQATSLQIELSRTIPLSTLFRTIITNYHNNICSNSNKLHRKYSGHLYRKGTAVCIDNSKGIFESVDEDGRLCLKRDNTIEHFSDGRIEFTDASIRQ